MMYNSIVVSVTVIDSRLDLLKRTLVSIFNQTQKPDILHVFYSNEPMLYDKGISDDTMQQFREEMELLNVSAAKLIITKTPNIGPYRKLIPALKIYKNDIIITIDDDHEYEVNFIKNYMEAYMKHKCIICSSGRSVDFINLSNNLAHMEKIQETSVITLLYILPEGFGGILYHSNMFNDDFIELDYSSLSDLILKNDDFFFRVYTFRREIRVFYINVEKTYLLDIERQVSLYRDSNSKLNWNRTIEEISALEIMKAYSTNTITSIADEIELEKIYSLFKSRVSTGADIKVLQYEINSLVRVNDTIDLQKILAEKLQKEVTANFVIINLEKDMKRYFSAVGELKKLSSTTFVHLKATYWKEKDKFVRDMDDVLQFLKQFNPAAFVNPLSMNAFSEMNDPNIFIQDGPLACYCSHLRAMIYGYLHFAEYTIIVEDDILVSNTRNIETYIKMIPDDWDIICLNAGPINKVYTEPYYKFTDKFHSTHFYIIRNRCFPVLFANMYPIVDQVDILIAGLHGTLNIYNIPDTVYQKNFASNTQNNMYIIMNSPNYAFMRSQIATLKTILTDYITYRLPGSTSAQDIANSIMLDVIYNYIVNNLDMERSSAPAPASASAPAPAPASDPTLFATDFKEYRLLYEYIYIMVQYAVKGINLTEKTISLLQDINYILDCFTLHSSKIQALGYGSTSNTYMLEDRKILKVYNQRLRWSIEGHNNSRAIYERELSILQRLVGRSQFPQLISHDSEQMSLTMTYMGKSLYTDFVLPADWKEQISALFVSLTEVNIYYPEFNLKNILLLDGQLTFVDFGLATLDGDKINVGNEKVFVGLLETLDNKFRTLDNPEQKRVLYSTFINNLKIENTAPNNVF